MAVAQVPNGGLETWKTFSYGPLNFNYPEKFLTSNFTSFQGAELSVTQVGGVNGGKAAQLKTHLVEEDGNMVAVSGMMTSLKGEHAFNNMFNNKFKVTGKPSKLEGYYAYAPVQGDTFSIALVLYQNGLPIGTAELRSHTAVANLTAFSADIDYFGSSAMPDSASIAIFSSANEEIHEGTILTVDELKLYSPGSGSTGIFSDDKTFNGTVYPVPAQSTLKLQLPEVSSDMAQVELFDMSGKLLLTHKIEAYSETVSMDISALPNGVFFGTLLFNGQKQSFKATKN